RYMSDNNVDYGNALQLSMCKLLCLAEQDIRGELGKERLAALLLMRMAVRAVPKSAMSLDLTRRHMAQCAFISGRRDDVLVKYVSEPLLASAACELWASKDKKLILGILENLRTCLVEGLLVGTGDRGEMVGMLLLCLCWLRACEEATDEASGCWRTYSR